MVDGAEHLDVAERDDRLRVRVERVGEPRQRARRQRVVGVERVDVGRRRDRHARHARRRQPRVGLVDHADALVLERPQPRQRGLVVGAVVDDHELCGLLRAGGLDGLPDRGSVVEARYDDCGAHASRPVVGELSATMSL